MIRLLDTNTCIYYLNKASDKLVAQFKKFSPADIKLSSIAVAELFFGAEKSKAREKNWAVVEQFVSTFEIIPFDGPAAKYMQRYGLHWRNPARQSVPWIF